MHSTHVTLDAELERHGATAHHLLSDVRDFLERKRSQVPPFPPGPDGSLRELTDLPVELRRRVLRDMLPGLRQPFQEWRELVINMWPPALPGVVTTAYYKVLIETDDKATRIPELVLDLEGWILRTLLLRADNSIPWTFDGLVNGNLSDLSDDRMPEELLQRLDSMDDKTRPNASAPYLLTEYLLSHGRWLALLWMLAVGRKRFYELCLYAVQTDNLLALLFLLDRRRTRMTESEWRENPFQWTPHDDFTETAGQSKSVWDLRSAISHWMVLYGAWQIADFIWTIDRVDDEISTVPHVLKLWAGHLHHAMPLGHVEFVVHLIVRKRLLDSVEPDEYDRIVRAVISNTICDLRLYRFFSIDLAARPSDAKYAAREILAERSLDAWINQWRHQPIDTALNTLRLIVKGKPVRYSPDRIVKLRTAIDDMFVQKKISDDDVGLRLKFDAAVNSLLVVDQRNANGRNVRQRTE